MSLCLDTLKSAIRVLGTLGTYDGRLEAVIPLIFRLISLSSASSFPDPTSLRRSFESLVQLFTSSACRYLRHHLVWLARLVSTGLLIDLARSSMRNSSCRFSLSVRQPSASLALTGSYLTLQGARNSRVSFFRLRVVDSGSSHLQLVVDSPGNRDGKRLACSLQ